MLKPAPLNRIPHFPVCAGVALGAVAITGLWWSGMKIDGLAMDAQVWEQWELWRALTSSLPHVDIMHLAFNLYWFWVLGTVLEEVYGHLRFAGIVALLAFGSALADFSLSWGGVGLSGVGYGLWGMLWVLQQHDHRFAGAVDVNTSRLFVGWFLFCIVLTYTGAMAVANIAHAVGAILGALLGMAVSRHGLPKMVSIAAIALVVLLGVAGSTLFWPQINRTEYASFAVEHAGVNALYKKDHERSIQLLNQARKMMEPQVPGRVWFNLGIAYQGQGRYEKALEAYEQAAELPDADEEMRKSAREMKEYVKSRAEK